MQVGKVIKGIIKCAVSLGASFLVTELINDKIGEEERSLPEKAIIGLGTFGIANAVDMAVGDSMDKLLNNVHITVTKINDETPEVEG